MFRRPEGAPVFTPGRTTTPVVATARTFSSHTSAVATAMEVDDVLEVVNCISSMVDHDGIVESHRMFLLRRTTLEMLHDRGYVPEAKLARTLPEFSPTGPTSPNSNALPSPPPSPPTLPTRYLYLSQTFLLMSLTRFHVFLCLG
ncbi:hypothetical protein GUJ93_ZPchr0005g14514 [Zizania palustris]|uniref:RNA polymerase Rpb5 N-terminal domain-containing protein n=1 Tax=Zizania palustris TaxID=103762 RepID=A0A8J5VRU6_ZIZPA|nr:hypothetical protein GUJ93_ZPchr0005g14514 [Zizania palustris]